VGFGLVNRRWVFSAGRFYWVPLPVARQTPNLEENQGFRAFQLSPQEASGVWSGASEPSSGRWNYGREVAEKFCRNWRLPRHFWVLLHAVKDDMGQTALLPLPPRKEGVLRIFFARKIRRLRPGLNPRTWVPKASTLPLDHRSRHNSPLYFRISLVPFGLQRPAVATCTTNFNIKHLYALLTEYIYVFCKCFRTNSDSNLCNISWLIFISCTISVSCAVRIQSLTDYVSTIKS
jgi:hypothetical protein